MNFFFVLVSFFFFKMEQAIGNTDVEKGGGMHDDLSFHSFACRLSHGRSSKREGVTGQEAQG